MNSFFHSSHWSIQDKWDWLHKTFFFLQQSHRDLVRFGICMGLIVLALSDRTVIRRWTALKDSIFLITCPKTSDALFACTMRWGTLFPHPPLSSMWPNRVDKTLGNAEKLSSAFRNIVNCIPRRPQELKILEWMIQWVSYWTPSAAQHITHDV